MMMMTTIAVIIPNIDHSIALSFEMGAVIILTLETRNMQHRYGWIFYQDRTRDRVNL